MRVLPAPVIVVVLASWRESKGGSVYQTHAFGADGSPYGGEGEMNMSASDKNTSGKNERRPYRVRLPGFITDKDVGLGDAIKRATSTAGVRPCGGCARRADALNRWLGG